MAPCTFPVTRGQSWRAAAFAVEHVHGHHKNVGLASDPATAKRGENIYWFIINATLKEHRDAWKIELDQMKRRSIPIWSIRNKMTLGYLRSAAIITLAFFIGGLKGTLFFLLFSSPKTFCPPNIHLLLRIFLYWL